MKNWSLQMGIVAAALVVVAGVAFSGQGPNQQPASGGTTVFNWKSTSYFDDAFRQLKMLEISGKEVTPDSTGKLMLIKQLRVESFRLIPEKITNELSLVMEAPGSEFNQATHTLRSPGPLKIRSGDGRLLIEGTGFHMQETSNNMVLTISNDVTTTILSNAVNSPTGEADAEPTVAIQIHSKTVKFDRNANRITYTQEVRADNAQFNMTCDVMNVLLATNSAGVKQVEADGNVVMNSLGGGGRVTGSNAVYVATKGGNTVTMTGDPHWHDGLREGTARTFYYDGISNTFRAEGEAHFRLPQDALGSGGFELVPIAATNTTVATTNVAASTNIVELTAATVLLLLPPTNGPILGMIAETNVIILDPGSEGKATGDRVHYTATNGVMELTGNASAQSGQQMARGSVLRYDKIQKSFSAETNAFLRMPASSLGDSLNVGDTAAVGQVNNTNLYLEVRSATYEFTNNVLTFHNQVKAVLLEGDVTRATLDCNTLAVTLLGKTLQQIVAETDVVAHQLPTLNADGRVVEREIKCDRLQIDVRTNRLLQQIVALGHCKTIQIVTVSNRPAPIRLGSASEEINIYFRADTNAVERAVSERHVVFIREDKILRGARAEYTATNDTTVLSGDPSFETAGVLFTAQNSIVYDHANGTINASARPRATIQLSPEMLGQARIMPGPKKTKK